MGLLVATLALPACPENLWDTGSADTEDVQDPNIGVNVGCQNIAADAGADETGAEGGGPQGDNWWWKSCTPPQPQTQYQLCGGNVTDEICCQQGLDACWCKEYALPASANYDGGAGPICVTPGYTGGLDPLEDWVAGEYPTIDGALRADCSEICEMSNGWDVLPESCAPQNWIKARTFNGWEPSDGFNCQPGEFLNVGDPDGSAIDWSVVGGVSTPVPLDCDIDSVAGDCVDWFQPSVAPWIINPRSAAIIEPETRAAHYLGVEASGSELEIDMSGSGAGVDDTEPLFGFAEYTALECDDDACAFFLANLSAYNTTDTWDIRVETPIGRMSKSVSDVQIDLLQSTLGVRNMALSTVAFAPGALRLRVQFTVASCPTCDDHGNGTHVEIVENDTYVFADYDDGELTIDHAFAMQSAGTATLTVTVEPAEHPPAAEHDLSATEECDVWNGLVLDGTHSLSSDPDSDIALELWWIDGVPCGLGCVLPMGSHFVHLEAHDSRGAVHRTDGEWVYVDNGPACWVL